jgi:hypothetical protein
VGEGWVAEPVGLPNGIIAKEDDMIEVGAGAEL